MVQHVILMVQTGTWYITRYTDGTDGKENATRDALDTDDTDSAHSTSHGIQTVRMVQHTVYRR